MDLLAQDDGYLAAIDAETIGKASVSIGAGVESKGEQIDHSVGFVLRAKLGDKVEKGQPLLTIHAASRELGHEVERELRSGFGITNQPPDAPPVVIDVVA